jgi:hypothetical protein
LVSEITSPNDTTSESGALRSHVVRSEQTDDRDWLRDPPVCGILGEHPIAHVEILEAHPPFEMTRKDQSGSCMLVCVGGTGSVGVNGKGQSLTAGHACLLPPFVTNGLRVSGPGGWKHCTVRYHESREVLPILSQDSPVIGPYDSQPLLMAI